MIIGCPKEIKNHEYRVGLTPTAVSEYVKAGNSVIIEQDAGFGSGFTDGEYLEAGATIETSPEKVWEAEMIVKVKEPLESEWPLMKRNQIIFTYFHFAANDNLAVACGKAGIVAIPYETVQEYDGTLPLLRPMSEIAGRMAPIIGSYYSMTFNNGNGVLPSGVTGVAPGNVLIMGGGVVGSNAAKVAAGMGAKVTIIDVNLKTLESLRNTMSPNVFLVHSSDPNRRSLIQNANIVIGAVLIPGAEAPKVLSENDIRSMSKGTVFVDVAIDQGGCSETSYPTTHSDPVYYKHGVTHYCVTNMPSSFARSATLALNAATLPYGIAIASNKCYNEAIGKAKIRF